MWGGVHVQVSKREPVVLPPHQVAIVKTYEVINIPRFLVARWNLRVQWVYEGLLWVGGPQVDPGWKGKLFCPIYNLAEREIVIPYKARVFTMDFSRTTPVYEERKATWGYKTKPHKPARPKDIQGHDPNRLRSAPFEALSQLATLDTRVNSFISLTFLVLAVMIAAIGVIAALSGGGAEAVNEVIRGEEGLLVLLAVAMVFGPAALFVSSIAMVSRFGGPPKGRGKLTSMAIIGSLSLGIGGGYAGVLLTRGPPEWTRSLEVLLIAATGLVLLSGIVILYLVWLQATRTRPIQAHLGLSLNRRAFSMRINNWSFSTGRSEHSEEA